MKKSIVFVVVLCMAFIISSFSINAAEEKNPIEILVKVMGEDSEMNQKVLGKFIEIVDSYKNLKACVESGDMEKDAKYPYVFIANVAKNGDKISLVLNFMDLKSAKSIYQNYFEVVSIDEIAAKINEAIKSVTKSIPELKEEDSKDVEKED